MNAKNSKGFVGTDIIISIIAVIIFSGLIFSMMYNNFWENLKIKADSLAIIYLTETLEQIGIADYEEVTQENSMNFMSADLLNSYYNINLEVTQENEITKKIRATISYKLVNKRYQQSIERIKIKESI